MNVVFYAQVIFHVILNIPLCCHCFHYIRVIDCSSNSFTHTHFCIWNHRMINKNYQTLYKRELGPAISHQLHTSGQCVPLVGILRYRCTLLLYHMPHYLQQDFSCYFLQLVCYHMAPLQIIIKWVLYFSLIYVVYVPKCGLTTLFVSTGNNFQGQAYLMSILTFTVPIMCPLSITTSRTATSRVTFSTFVRYFRYTSEFLRIINRWRFTASLTLMKDNK